MQLRLKEIGFDLNKQNNTLFTQIQFGGYYRGCSLTAQLVKLTKSTIILGVQLYDTVYVENAKKSDCYVCFVDPFDFKSEDEKRAYRQFNVNAMKYEYITRITNIKPTPYCNGHFNYLIEMSIKQCKESFWRVVTNY